MTNKTQAQYEAKRNATDQAVHAIIEAERAKRADKTAKLRALRLAQDTGRKAERRS